MHLDLESRSKGGAVFVAALLLGTTLLFPSCKKDSNANAEAQQPAAQAPVNAAELDPKPNTPAAPKVDGNQAYKYAADIVAFGPRPIGSPTHVKVESYIKSKLQGADIEEDKFTANTPVGAFPMNNIIAKFPGKKDGVIVLASHYDTNYPLKDTKFVGANDGAATSALLLAIGDQLRGKQLDGYSVWLVFTDGEEATKEWSESDSLYGSKHLAQKWATDGTAKKVKAFILLDMIGDKDLGVDRDPNSTPWLSDVVYRAATRLGVQSHWYKREMAMEDDHLPFKNAGIPVVDVIDFDYGWNNIFHHTTEDTLDKISGQSLQIVGDVVLETIRALNTK